MFFIMPFSCTSWETEETGPVLPDFWGMRRTPMYSRGFVLCKNYDTLQYDFMDSICAYVTRTIVNYRPLFDFNFPNGFFLWLNFIDYESMEEIWNTDYSNICFEQDGNYEMVISGNSTRMYEYSFNYGPYTIETTDILSPFFTKFNRVELYEDTVLDYVERDLCRKVIWRFLIKGGKIIEALFTDNHEFYYDLLNNKRIMDSEFRRYPEKWMQSSD